MPIHSAIQKDWSVWYSARAVYQKTIGCQLDRKNLITFEWFPDVPRIFAIFRSENSNRQSGCMFSSVDGILKAEMLPEEWIALSNNTYFATVYYQPNDLVPINFFICKKVSLLCGITLTCIMRPYLYRLSVHFGVLGYFSVATTIETFAPVIMSTYW
ncbi:hypothetical protein AHF37_00619 [Paragonimus kellicotti]|nr:hypothetical protein AHF37_00619 [Paragonimus kellicotti]